MTKGKEYACGHGKETFDLQNSWKVVKITLYCDL